MHGDTEFGDQENVRPIKPGIGQALTGHRCFLFLVNYARLKPDIALKALPVLVQV